MSEPALKRHKTDLAIDPAYFSSISSSSASSSAVLASSSSSESTNTSLDEDNDDDDEGNADDDQEDHVFLPPTFVFPFSSDKSRFRVVNLFSLNTILDLLDIVDILKLSTINKLWNNHLDEQQFWVNRYISDLGRKHYDNLLRNETQGDNACGWSVKQHLIWSLISNAIKQLNPNIRFDIQRNVWIGIMKERKRKGLQYKRAMEERKKLTLTSASTTSASTSTSTSTSTSSSSLSAISISMSAST